MGRGHLQDGALQAGPRNISENQSSLLIKAACDKLQMHPAFMSPLLIFNLCAILNNCKVTGLTFSWKKGGWVILWSNPGSDRSWPTFNELTPQPWQHNEWEIRDYEWRWCSSIMLWYIKRQVSYGTLGARLKRWKCQWRIMVKVSDRVGFITPQQHPCFKGPKSW